METTKAKILEHLKNNPGCDSIDLYFIMGDNEQNYFLLAMSELSDAGKITRREKLGINYGYYLTK